MRLLLLSNSTAPGQGFLEHAVEAIADLLEEGKRMAFFAQASFEPRRYAQIMQQALQPIGVRVSLAGVGEDLAAELEQADAVFVGGGNSFRLLKALQAESVLEAIRERVKAGSALSWRERQQQPRLSHHPNDQRHADRRAAWPRRRSDSCLSRSMPTTSRPGAQS